VSPQKPLDPKAGPKKTQDKENIRMAQQVVRPLKVGLCLPWMGRVWSSPLEHVKALTQHVEAVRLESLRVNNNHLIFDLGMPKKSSLSDMSL
jgi:hypothetical protein